MTQREKMKKARERLQLLNDLNLQFFELDGSVKPGLVFGDPYRRDPKDTTSLAATQFTKDGDVSEEMFQEAQALVQGGLCHPASIAACVYHAQVHGSCTGGAYPASYYFR